MKTCCAVNGFDISKKNILYFAVQKINWANNIYKILKPIKRHSGEPPAEVSKLDL